MMYRRDSIGWVEENSAMRQARSVGFQSSTAEGQATLDKRVIRLLY